MNLKLLETGFFYIVSILAVTLLVAIFGVGFMSIMDKITELWCLFV